VEKCGYILSVASNDEGLEVWLHVIRFKTCSLWAWEIANVLYEKQIDGSLLDTVEK
jgi:hypothetical protein